MNCFLDDVHVKALFRSTEVDTIKFTNLFAKMEKSWRYLAVSLKAKFRTSKAKPHFFSCVTQDGSRQYIMHAYYRSQNERTAKKVANSCSNKSMNSDHA